jgi:hypothetical protein
MFFMINNVFHWTSITPAKKKSSCHCVPDFYRYTHQNSMMRTLPTTLGRAMQQEFFVPFFQNKEFHFTCGCDLYAQLDANKLLFEHVRSVKVDWRGSGSDKGFLKLAQCPNLQKLTIVVSKSTLANLNQREQVMRSFFALSYKASRVTDSMGIDELLTLRGLKEVRVEHPALSQKRMALSDLDIAGLQGLLEAHLKLQRAVRYLQQLISRSC